MRQSKALAIMKSGRNVFLTGSAGAGKTYVLNQYIKYLREHRIGVAITASTGIAATHMNGQTVHSWSGIGIRNEISHRHLVNLKEKKYFRDKIEKAKVLIIDEISMLHRRQLDLVNEVLKFFKETEEPFGGLQVIFSGDFFQLPPIGEEWESSRDKFAFMSDAWVEANVNVCYITEQHRQSDNPLNFILNEIRSGNVSQESIDLLQDRLQLHHEEDDNETQLFTHNYDVSRTNLYYLDKIGKESRTFEATTFGNPVLVEMLTKSVLAEEILEIKVGAQVMFVRNNYEAGYVNGTIGRVSGFSPKGFPLVKTVDGELIEAKEETWAIEDETGKALASFTQIPLKLAWAITIHKSQGMTLDAAKIDLSRAFEKGQGYVALSRLRDIKGLKLLGLNQMALEIDSLAFKAEQRFAELSNELDETYTEEELQKEFIPFIKRCGGLTSAKDIARNREKLAQSGKAEKESTYQQTKVYVETHMSIDQIAEARGLSKGTILSHLIRLSEVYPEMDFSKYKPENEILEKVKKAVQLQKEEEKLSLSKLYNDLNKEISYDTIKQTLIFIKK